MSKIGHGVIMFGFDPDSMAAYYAEQGFNSMLTGEEEDPGVECKYCHRWPFFWANAGTAAQPKWRLTTTTGKTHKCKHYGGQR